MRYSILTLAFLTILTTAYVPTPASALSCLPVDMYIKSVIGKEDTIIFAAKATDTITEKEYTAEVLLVNTVYQGYVDKNLMAYHHKNETWGYMCNAGPQGTGTEGIYIATKDATGLVTVSQRLTVDSELMKDIKAELTEKKITGEILETTTTDRINEIRSTISDLFTKILTLVKEQMYWQRNTK